MLPNFCVLNSRSMALMSYVAPAATRLLQNVFQPRNFNTSLSLGDKDSPPGPPPPSGVGHDRPPVEGTSARYLEEMYNAWLKDPTSVHPSWDGYFRRLGAPIEPRIPKKERSRASYVLHDHPPHLAAPAATSGSGGGESASSTEEHLNVQALIRSYQVRGHLVALINPLEDMFDITDKKTCLSEKTGKQPPEVVRYHKITSSMWNNPYQLPPSCKVGGNSAKLPLKEIVKRLELSYCRHIGVEYMHINDIEKCDFIREKFEYPGVIDLSKAEKRLLLNRLAKAVMFEGFLQKKWDNEKRFGLEGCEIMIPCIKTVIDYAAKQGAEMAIVGMAHRGRLNLLANVCHKPLELIFSQFRGLEPEDQGAGDVKYHLGVFDKREHPISKKPFATVLVANPSHLELINPVVAGRAKAEQFYRNDEVGDKVYPIIVHGDAAFCGEGIVYETINLANLTGYHNGGTVHVVVNNQIGFTTDPKYSRSSPYCTDVGRVVNAPIFHVNADDPESCVYATKVAVEYRAKFHTDVVIDLVGYRRHGHNETDEPMFTQPLMYKKIRAMPNVLEKYTAAAIKEGVVTQDEVKTFKEQITKDMEVDFAKAAKHTSMRFSDWIDSPWPGFFKSKDPKKIEPTGVSMEVLETIGKRYSEPPPGEFELHRGLLRVLSHRQDMVKKQIADWSIGEAMAISTLLKEGFHVRLSGEDVQRGTFSHRHHVVHHQSKPMTTYQYLADFFPNQAHYTVSNSPISEYGILGFEHGYSMAKPDQLVIWEAQFGDFANNAQAMFDCMICSGQWKWIRQCGLVVLMPHGLEGQGPEHSSGRIERFLQSCDDDGDHLPPDTPDYVIKQLREINWIIANCTVPSNLFHVLRRQMKMPFRKPLVIFTPKSLLRHPEARSQFSEMVEGKEFQRLLPAVGPAAQNPGNAKKLVFCTGKVYYDFMKTLREQKLEDKIAIARIEQLCPFPYDLILKEIQKYSGAQVYWGQEEHKNSGCWDYMEPRLITALKGAKPLMYIGRAPSASTASGNKIQYQTEYKLLMADLTKL
ncbi:unnamed protein product [Ceutorhynchus assimilis]|uniref:2-oxoglutarate dehydrogenase, mitochondrial n=1 Tax=Ceutorhynchus assimilis TaxID=467358 RepID=A0A9N9MNZ6_9CUCU|nr:unnamed protein product [Ceutorhynchus assimilis]